MEFVNQMRERLFALSEPKFQKFSAALIPGEERMLGVRLPALRALAKEIARSDSWADYLDYADSLAGSLKRSCCAA